MVFKTIQAVHLYLLALFAGISWISVFGNVPAANTFPASVYTFYMQAIIVTYTSAVQILSIITVLNFMVYLSLIKNRKSLYFAITLLAFISVIGGLVTTIAGNFPINEYILSWSPQAPPAHWKVVRDQWNQINVVRFIFAQIALISSLSAIFFLSKEQTTKKVRLALTPEQQCQASGQN